MTSPHEPSNAARRVLDGVKYVTDTVSAYSSPSSRVVTDWIADQVAPEYWIPNSQINVSHLDTELAAVWGMIHGLSKKTILAEVLLCFLLMLV